MTMNTRESQKTDGQQASGMALVVITVLVGSLLLVSLAASSGLAATNTTTNNSSLDQTAPYYDNQTAIGNETSWVPTDVSLSSLGDMVGRVGPYIIGIGDTIPGGKTYAGTIITGLLMSAIFIGAVSATSIGTAGGAVVATIAGYGLIELGLAPGWLRLVLLLIIGVAAGVAVLRTTD